MNLFSKYAKGNRRKKAQIIVLLSVLFSLLGIMTEPPIIINPLRLFAFFLIGIYLLFLIFEGHIKRIQSVLQEPYKRIWKRWYLFLISYTAWYLLVIPIAYSRSADLLLIWIYSSIIVTAILPSIYSLSAYLPAAKYISSTKNPKENRKKVADSITLLSIFLNLPIFVLIYMILLLALNIILPYWAVYLFVAIGYLFIFFIAIDLPYFLGAEDDKNRKLRELENTRSSLLQRLCQSDCQTNYMLTTTLELNIMRIDREKEEVKTETSHTHGAVKAVASYLIVSVITALVIEAIISYF